MAHERLQRPRIDFTSRQGVASKIIRVDFGRSKRAADRFKKVTSEQ